MSDPATTIAINVGGTANVFAAARDAKVGRVIYASSSSVYGDSPTLPKREGEEGKPLSPYAASKMMNEQLADLFARCFGMQFVGLRYFNVYGPRQDPDGAYAAVIPRFFKACLAGEAPVIYGDGEQSRDFTYVSDAVAANLAAAEASGSMGNHAYNVAGGRQTTVNELARLVREASGSGLAADHVAQRHGDVAHSLADLENVRTLLGWMPRVELTEGLAMAKLHYRNSVLTVGAVLNQQGRRQT
jgi:nucleoside-diphosphate-sugar epimerase